MDEFVICAKCKFKVKRSRTIQVSIAEELLWEKICPEANHVHHAMRCRHLKEAIRKPVRQPRPLIAPPPPAQSTV
jgi:hypothetical protein